MELHAGGNNGDEKQLIDLEWPNITPKGAGIQYIYALQSAITVIRV